MVAKEKNGIKKGNNGGNQANKTEQTPQPVPTLTNAQIYTVYPPYSP